MAIIPPYLKKGDTIGIVCPAGFMPYDKAETCVAVLRQWGFNVVEGQTLGSEYNYFSATDEERLNDLQQMLDDKNIKAILFGRGGYGTTRIIDQLNFKHFKRNPKWLIGFSDITLLLAHIYRRFNIAGLHSPMAAAFNNNGYKGIYIQSLRKTLTGKKNVYKTAAHVYNNNGTGVGELVGGNLALLVHAVGTPSDVDTRGKILFIEDVGEYLYNVDRMMYQLKRTKKLQGLKGLIFGGFSNMKDTAIPFGIAINDLLKDIVKEYNFPVCFNFPVGHQPENFALKIGGLYELKVTARQVTLREQ